MNAWVRQIAISIWVAVICIVPSVAYVQSMPINAYLFYSESCPHCAAEEMFLDELKKEINMLHVSTYEVSSDAKNIQLLQKVAKKLNVRVDGVPFLIIGGRSFIGYTEGMTDKQIRWQIEDCLHSACEDIVGGLLEQEDAGKNREGVSHGSLSDTNGKKESLPTSIPLIGTVDISSYSLPVLTIIMGALDGFNPCAMWILLFLISLLLGMKSRKRMWILGSTFIVASASVYFLFMSAWLNLILFIGFTVWVRSAIGLFAIGGGGWNIKEFFLNKGSGCSITDNEKRQGFFQKMKEYIHQSHLILAVGGIALLAFAVNLVELMCSAGLPAIYTQVLAMNSVPLLQRYAYILLYVFFFMLDDLIVFIVAMVTLEMIGVTTKYAKISRLIGGVLMLAIGLLLLFKPEWLLFG